MFEVLDMTAARRGHRKPTSLVSCRLAAVMAVVCALSIALADAAVEISRESWTGTEDIDPNHQRLSGTLLMSDWGEL